MRTYAGGAAQVKKLPLLRVHAQQHIGGLQVSVHLPRLVQTREELCKFERHSQNRGESPVRFFPRLQRQATIHDHEGRKCIPAAACDCARVIGYCLHERWEGVRKRRALVQRTLALVVGQ